MWYKNQTDCTTEKGGIAGLLLCSSEQFLRPKWKCKTGEAVDARTLIHPISNDQVRNTLKLSDVVCDQNHIFRSGVRGDHHIQWANRRTSILQVGSDFAVSCCTMLRGFIDRKNSCRSITARTIGAAGGYRHSLSNRGWSGSDRGCLLRRPETWSSRWCRRRYWW